MSGVIPMHSDAGLRARLFVDEIIATARAKGLSYEEGRAAITALTQVLNSHDEWSQMDWRAFESMLRQITEAALNQRSLISLVFDGEHIGLALAHHAPIKFVRLISPTGENHDTDVEAIHFFAANEGSTFRLVRRDKGAVTIERLPVVKVDEEETIA